ncbi:hypothetical protein LAZ67_19002693 [Cordylochernes scorpioides]|uniref:Reverse transcriptase zinc-binding domain-containing protein n=1 Tax=Cordylochernes scorpioides TaxID=51811 RepID=A0ABY6LIS3_9ARAC|nr:hypothetical protein LAZ67_19002693 [Cordylochernes scorpioides]
MSSVNYLIEPKDNPGQDPLVVHVSRIKPYYERMDELAFSWLLYSQDHSTRSLRRIASTPSLLLKFLPNIRHREASTTILTGHVLADITHVYPETDSTCIHCSEEPQTVDHILFNCPAFLRHRMQTAILLRLHPPQSYTYGQPPRLILSMEISGQLVQLSNKNRTRVKALSTSPY